jgi:hypothetical protein
VEGRERELATREKKMREGGGGGAHMRGGHQGCDRGRVGLGRGPGRKPTARTRLPLIESKLRIENRSNTNTRLDTTSDKRNMPQHDATPMST